MSPDGRRRASAPRLLTVVALALFAAACGGGGGSDSGTVTLRLAHPLSTPNTSHDAIVTKELPAAIEEATDGAVKVQPIVGVIDTNEVLNGLREGRIEMAALSPSYLDQTHPLWAVLDLPGLGADKDPRLAARIAADVVRPVWEKDLETWGASVGAIMTYPGTYFFSNGPVDSVDKFSGTRYRTHTGQVTRFVEALGGAPVGLEFAELQPSLERGIVDAFTAGLAPLGDSDVLGAVDYVETWPMGLGTNLIVYSDAALADLEPELQQKVKKVLADIQETVADRQAKEAEDALKRALDSGDLELVEIPAEEYDRAVAVARENVWQPWLEQTGSRGQQLLDDVQRAFDAGLSAQSGS